MTTFRFEESFDPQDQKEYTWFFALHADESALVSAVVDQVSEALVAPITPSLTGSLVLGTRSFGVASDEALRAAGIVTTKTVWGVTQWLLPMGADPVEPFMAYLRCKVTTDASPTPRIMTKTMKLYVAQD